MTFLTTRTRPDFDYFPSLLDGFFEQRGEEFRGLTPKVNVSEVPSGYHLEAELPGVEEGDIHLNYEKGVLTLSGERKETINEKDKSYLRRETRVGKFSRSFRLSEQVDPEAIRATFRNGVLSVDLPKNENHKAKQIPINNA